MMRASPGEPIFIVGSGRSGTTILYEMLCTHPALCWASNFTDRFPRSPAAIAASNLYRNDLLRARRPRWLPIPSEAYPLWDEVADLPPGKRNDALTERDVTDTSVTRWVSQIQRFTTWQRKERFINKNTRNTRRIRYLHGLSPGASFVHVLRDPRATVASLIRVPWWRSLALWTRGGSTPEELRHEISEVRLAAELWYAEVECALSDKEAIHPRRYTQVRYEDLVRNPTDVVSAIAETCGLHTSPQFRSTLSTFTLTDQNRQFRTRLSPDQIGFIEDLTAPVARLAGYDFSM